MIRPIILGIDGLKMCDAKVDVGNRNILLRTDKGQQHCLGIKDQEGEDLCICEIAELIEETRDQIHAAAKYAVDENGVDVSHSVETLVSEYQNVFEGSKEPVKGYQFKIELMDEEPFNVKQYPIPHVFKAEVRKQINTMLEDGIIKKSMTPYVSPIVIVRKKDNKIRFCIDARKLNSKTIARHEKPPKLDEMGTYNYRNIKPYKRDDTYD